MKSIVKVYMWLMIIITIFSAIGVASTGYVIVQLFNSPSELKTNPIKGKFKATQDWTNYELDIDGTTGILVATDEYENKEVADVEVDYSKHVIKVPSQNIQWKFKHLNSTIFITGSKDGLVFTKEK